MPCGNFAPHASSDHGSPACTPSAVQHECIPHAILGMDVLCQAKSGMGKTAVFVLSILQQIEAKPGEVSALVLCHTRELAYQVRCTAEVPRSCKLPRTLADPWRRPATKQSSFSLSLQICHEFERFSARFRGIKVANFFGGMPISANKDELKKDCPSVVVGTPGRIKQVRRQSCGGGDGGGHRDCEAISPQRHTSRQRLLWNGFITIHGGGC